MPPTIHFIRHAQGYHNLSPNNYTIHDPLLTPYGEQQCRLLSETFPYTRDVDLIVASPMKRTIYTALLSFPQWRYPIIALPELQETSDMPCDTGSRRDELDREFRNRLVDFSMVTEGWNVKQGRWSPDRAAIEDRCRIARRWLMDRRESHIVVVTHGGILHYLTQDWTDNQKYAGTGWANTEYRSYIFDYASGSECRLLETEESRTRRRGVERPLSEAEQRNFHRVDEVARENDIRREDRQVERQEVRQEVRQAEVRQAVRQEERREDRREDLRGERRDGVKLTVRL